MRIPDYLYQYATTHLWRNPHGDRQVIMRSVRITPVQGSLAQIRLPFKCIDLPSTDRYYVTYELSGTLPQRYGIDRTIAWWVPFHTLIRDESIYCNLFIEGRMLNLDTCYIRKDGTGTVMIAVEYLPNAYALTDGLPLMVRFYSNIHYLGSPPDDSTRVTYSSWVYDPDDFGGYLAFVNQYAAVVTEFTFTYHNGILIDNVIPPTTRLTRGDIIDYMNDPLIVRSERFDLLELESFNSVLDSRRKLIMSSYDTERGIYVDDIEIYITGNDANGIRTGMFVPHVEPWTVRHLTYKDLALDYNTVLDRVRTLYGWDQLKDVIYDMHVELYYRENNQEHQVLLDSQRGSDLSRLPRDVRVQLLTGVNSNISQWQAANLERSPYNRWCSSEYTDITMKNLIGVYSQYSAVTVIERLYREYGELEWRLPVAVANGGGTLVRMNEDGYDPYDVKYDGLNHFREVVIGAGGYEIFYPGRDADLPLDIHVRALDPTTTTVADGYGIRCYYRDELGALQVAQNKNHYTLVDANDHTTIHWDSSVTQFDRYVRCANRTVRYERTLTMDDVRNGFDIYNGRIHINDVGMGNLYVWVNGRFATEGLDYYVDEARIHLVSIRSDTTETPRVRVIYAGLPDLNLKHNTKTNWGWVRYGKFSTNDIYNLYYSRNLLFYIDGRAVGLDDILGDEAYVDVVTALPFRDGTPYTSTPIVQFSRFEDYGELTTTLAAELQTDSEISGLLSEIYPQNQTTGLITIPSKYDLVSPFMNAVIRGIDAGEVLINRTTYSATAMYDMVYNYMDLLRVDPTQHGHDMDFVEIHPAWFSKSRNVTTAEYNFLHLVNDVVLNGQVLGLNKYLKLIAG